MPSASELQRTLNTEELSQFFISWEGRKKYDHPGCLPTSVPSSHSLQDAMVMYWGMSTAVVTPVLLHLSLRQAQGTTRKFHNQRRPVAVLGVAGCAAAAV